MAVRLITEVLRYIRRHAEVSTAERCVLMLIAERAQEQTREAWPGGTDDWDLAELAGLSATGLRGVLQRLAARGLEVRVAHGTNAAGRPVFAAWNRQTTYRLPILTGDAHTSPTQPSIGDSYTSPVGDTHTSPREEPQATPTRRLNDSVGDAKRPHRRRETTPQATRNDSVGDAQLSPYTSLPSGPSRSVTGNGREPRTAPPRGPEPEEQTPAAAGRELARTIAAKAQKRPPKVSHWTAGTAPQGDRNDAYDPAGTAERLAGEPAWEPDPDPDQTEGADRALTDPPAHTQDTP